MAAVTSPKPGSAPKAKAARDPMAVAALAARPDGGALARLGRRALVAGFIGALMVPGIAIALSPHFRTAVGTVILNFGAGGEQKEIIRSTTPLWYGAADLYGTTLYKWHTSSNPAAGVLGRDGFIFLGDFYNNSFSQSIHRQVLAPEAAAGWVETLAEQRAWLARRNIPLVFVVGPSTATIYPDKLPAWATTELDRPSSFDEVLKLNADRALGLALVDTRPALKAARARAETYGPLNSHWTGFGAWVAWQQIAATLASRMPDFRPFGTGDLKAVKPEPDHLNEFTRLLGIVGQPNPWDTYELAQPFPEMTVEAADGRTFTTSTRTETGLLDMPRITRTPGAPTQKRILVTRDSMGDALSPFLQASFAETVQVDHHVTYRDFTTVNLAGAVERAKPDAVMYIMAERMFDQPLGDLAFWRAANAFDLADAAAERRWQAGGEAKGASGGGSLNLAGADAFTLDWERGTGGEHGWVVRIEADAEGPAPVGLVWRSGGSEHTALQKIRRGLNPLFFSLPGDVEPGSVRLLRSEPGFPVAIRGVAVRPAAATPAG